MDDFEKGDFPKGVNPPLPPNPKAVSDDVILDMALKKEDYSVRFYQAVMELVEDGEAKRILSHLIEEERRHFRLLSDALIHGGYDKIGVPVERNSLEMTDYLIKKEIENTSGPADIMRLAIRREEAAEEFYLSRINYIKDKKLKDLYSRLAAEEGGHRKTLLSGYDDLMITDET
ncbi:MAG: ferritin family protein [bacterium]|nr:ferritin family protein [bacterium]